ncbi:hypothetical protein BC831DRAFT_478691, partial [Entophlyctis helioformis]
MRQNTVSRCHQSSYRSILPSNGSECVVPSAHTARPASCRACSCKPCVQATLPMCCADSHTPLLCALKCKVHSLQRVSQILAAHDAA